MRGSPGRSRPDFLPHFRRIPADSVLPEGELGVRIVSRGVESSGEPSRWPLHGAFRVPSAFAGAVPESVLHRIVVTLRSPYGIRSCFAFRDALLYPDDVQLHGEVVSGAFHLDVLRTFGVEPSPGYFVAASIGIWVSEIVVSS